MPGIAATITTADGVADAFLFRPDGDGPFPGVILFLDALGLRPAMMEMASRLASEGFAVLLPNLFYRSGPARAFAMSDFADEQKRAAVMAVMGTASIAAVRADTAAYLDFLEAQPFVSDRIGCVGYCFGGARAMTAMGAYPDRVAAVATIHASNLATEAADSPHLLAPQLAGGRVYVGIAGIDPSVPPEEAGRLAAALRAASVDHMIENYPGVRHGFAVSDTPVYDRPAAERHWNRVTRLFSEALAA